MPRRPSRRPVRALTRAASVAWAEVRSGPRRAVLLAVRLLPSRLLSPLRSLERRPAARPHTPEPSAARVPAPPGRPILPVRGCVLHLVTDGLPHA